MIVIYTNRPFDIVAYLVATLRSANKLSGTITRDINLVATLASFKKLSGIVAWDINLVATQASVN
jgi:hypothetical protein